MRDARNRGWPCRLWQAVAIAMLLAFALAGQATAASITITPNTGLTRNGHTVNVTGTGFGDADGVTVLQCRYRPQSGGCWNVGSFFIDGAGSFAGSVQLFYVSPGFTSCEDAYCKVYAYGDNDILTGMVPVAFEGSTTTTSTPSTGPGPFQSIPLGQSVTETAIVHGKPGSGSPPGQMGFWACGPDGYVICASGGTAVPGNPVTLVSGPNDTSSATSGSFTPTSPGRYCFRSMYFGSASHGASSSEEEADCFNAKVPSSISLTIPRWVRVSDPFYPTATVTGNQAGGPPTGQPGVFSCSFGDPCTQGGGFSPGTNLVAGPDNTAQSTFGGWSAVNPGRICLRPHYEGDSRYFGSEGTPQCIVVGYYPRPHGATPLRVPLVPAFRACTGANRTHGAPLSFPSCSPPAPQSDHVFIGVGDGDPAPAKSIGYVLVKAIVGDPAAPDDSDMSITTNISNVMNYPDRSDYTGELQTVLGLRLTDRETDSVQTPQTLQDFSFPVNVPCTPTADPTAGSVCSLTTTADSTMPGAVPEGLRSVWQLDQVRVFDGGADGDADTPADNQLFAVQGLFAP